MNDIDIFQTFSEQFPELLDQLSPSYSLLGAALEKLAVNEVLVIYYDSLWFLAQDNNGNYFYLELNEEDGETPVSYKTIYEAAIAGLNLIKKGE